jgi:tRNA(adenine34) deaminase
MQKKAPVYQSSAAAPLLPAHTHTYYMDKALDQAQYAFDRNEVPVGAIIVSPDGTIIARAYNKMQSAKSQTHHAELLALAKAGKKMGDWRLEGCWIFVTLEPCAMCINAITLSRLAGIVFGASSPVYGYQKVDNNNPSWVYKRNILAIIGGVCQEKAKKLLQEFFKQKRTESE